MVAGPRQPLARWNPIRDVWEQETLQDSLFSEPSGVFSGTWPASGSMRSGAVYAQPMWGPVTSAIGSSSSPGKELLPTPTARDWRDGEEPPSAAVPVNALLGRTIWHLPEGYDLPPDHAGLAEAWIPTGAASRTRSAPTNSFSAAPHHLPRNPDRYAAHPGSMSDSWSG